MFEKSLYDLIRGIRDHRFNERQYIRDSFRECQSEIRSSDLDVKATALLKLIYLEMLGHDMSWASFHVLEVMACHSYMQKRVGYLAAVQSFRQDTEVLMLATNLLKKDVSCAHAPTMSLVLITLPHFITANLAISLSSDLLPRLSHSNPNIRKKTIAVLYRAALIYPDTLRVSWPKITSMLMNEREDPSVISAVVNVICEIGWRRPQDLLAHAPRLFDLLIEGGNNWMAIKIIKLFSVLTPIEPRLVKKLLPPLTALIRTTSAMSLLYECIDGIIQGGILEGNDDKREGEAVASLCTSKLRGMILIEGDPNLRYVALLAFNKIVLTHPHLIFVQQDIIMSCIDDADTSIRMQALEMAARMVTRDSLGPFVERLLQQSNPWGNSDIYEGTESTVRLTQGPPTDINRRDSEENLDASRIAGGLSPLSAEYRINLIRYIVEMCSKENYANINDFDWYLELLPRLIKILPDRDLITSNAGDPIQSDASSLQSSLIDLSAAIGWELRNVAVRVKIHRKKAVQIAETFVCQARNCELSPTSEGCGHRLLCHAAWTVGEYASSCINLYMTMDALLCPRILSLSIDAICAYIQAIPKIYCAIILDQIPSWDIEHRTIMSLLSQRILEVLAPLSTHPNLEVQERAIELLELIRLASQAIADWDRMRNTPPLLLFRAMPDLYMGSELKPVAPSAQRKVPPVSGLATNRAINPRLLRLLEDVLQEPVTDVRHTQCEAFYYEQPILIKSAVVEYPHGFTASRKEALSGTKVEAALTSAIEGIERQIAHRENDRTDTFYIGSGAASSETSMPLGSKLHRDANDSFGLEEIPIMKLDLDDCTAVQHPRSMLRKVKSKSSNTDEVVIAKDETFELELGSDGQRSAESLWSGSMYPIRVGRKEKESLLDDNSKGLVPVVELHSRNADSFKDSVGESLDAEMIMALAEVEKLRLGMARASERVRAAEGIPADGTLVKKKGKAKKKRRKDESGSKMELDDDENNEGRPAVADLG